MTEMVLCPVSEIITQSSETITQSSAGLSSARYLYLDSLDEAELIDLYLAWVNRPVYIVLEDHLDLGTYKAFRGAKRGDEFYCHKTIERFEKVIDNIKDLDIQFGATWTQAVFVSLTYANQNEDNWNRVSGDFNRFMAKLRKRYGVVSAVRIWESHESGFVHVHVVLLFESRKFKTFEDRGGLIRLDRKAELAECWTCGFSDWQGVYDLEGALEYIKRDMTKFLNHESENDVRDLAKLWVYRKRTFSVSRRLDRARSNSNRETGQIWQITLDGWLFLVDQHNWRLVCVVGAMVDLSKVRITDVQQLASSGHISRYCISYSS